VKIPSKKELAALAFSPSEFADLLGKTPFRLILDAVEDSNEIYRDLCLVGRSLLDVRDGAKSKPQRHWPRESLLASQLLGPATRQLYRRAEKNIRASRELADKTVLLDRQRKDILSRTYATRKELGVVLRESFLEAEVRRA